MGLDLSQVPDEDLQNYKSGNLSAVSTEGLQAIIAAKRAAKQPSESPYKPKVTTYPGVNAPLGAQEGGAYSESEQKAAASGVDVDTGNPPNVNKNVKIGFTPPDTVTRTQSLRDSIIDNFKDNPRFNPKTDIRMGPQSGQMEYKNPYSGRWTMTSYPYGALVGDIIPAAAGVAGSAVGGAALAEAGPTAAGYGASAIGAFSQGVGEYLRRTAGRYLGFNPETASDSAGAAFREAGNAAAWNAAFETGSGVKNLIKWRVLGSSPVNSASAMALLNAYDKSKDLIDSINKITPTGVVFKPDIASVANNSSAIALRNQIAADPKYGGKILEQTQRNETALYDIFQVMGDKQGATAGTAASTFSDKVESGLSTAYGKQADPLMDSIYRMEQRALESNSPVVGQDKIALTDKIRQNLNMAAARAKAGRDAAYNERNRLMGSGEVIRVPLDDTFMLQVSGQSNLAANKVFNWATTQAKKLIPDLMDKEGAPLTHLSLYQINQAITDLGDQAAKATRGGTNTIGASKADILDMRDNFKGLRDRYLAANNPDLAEAVLKADQTNTEFQNMWRRGLVGRLINKNSDGSWKLADQAALGSILTKKSEQSYQQLLGATSQSPEARQLIREAYLGAYSREATENGIPTVSKHDAFMAKYGPGMEGFFSNIEMAGFKNRQALGASIASTRAELEGLRTTFKANYGIDVSDLNSEGLVSKFYSSSPEDWSKILRGAKSIDAKMGTSVEEGTKEMVLNRFLDSAMDKQSRTLSVDKLSKALDDPMRVKMEQTFGKAYTDNVRQVLQGLRMSRGIDAPTLDEPSRATLFSYIARFTYAPPLSREGRFLTFIGAYRAKRYSQFLYDAFYNPDKLRELANAGFQDVKNARAARIFNTLGMNYYERPEYTDQKSANQQ